VVLERLSKLCASFDALPAAVVCVSDGDVGLNRGAETLTGYDHHELRRLDALARIIDGEPPDYVARRLAAGDTDGPRGRLVFTLRRKDESRARVEFVGRQHGRIVHWVVRALPDPGEHRGDVSDDAFHRVADEMPVMLWTSSPDHRNVAVNRRFADFLGITDTNLGDTWDRYVHPDDAAATNQAFRYSVRERRDFATEMRVRCSGGSWRWMLSVGTPRFAPDGALLGFSGSLTDITERRDAERALRLEADASALLASSLDTEVLLDRLVGLGLPLLGDACVLDFFRDGRHTRRIAADSVTPDPPAIAPGMADGADIPHLDPVLLERVLSTREPLLIPIVTDPLVDAIAQHDPQLGDIMRARGLRSLLMAPMLARGEVLGVMTFLAFGVERQLGEREQTLALAVAGRAAAALQNADLFAAARAELVERRRAEAQLLQAQKLEAVGRLAGGVAHDFNNLLMVINGCAEFLLEDCGEDDPARQDVMEIKRAAERGAALTRQLLTFSRNQVVRPRHVGLNALVQDMEKMLQRLIGEDVSLSISLSVEPPVAFVDPGQIEQALANLAVNARDAMPRGGQLRISTGHAVFDASDAAMRPEIAPGKYVLLSVSDTGSGMDAATQARIFEPFFTTKEPGKGTGLGLATVFGIVKQAGGHIVVYSEPGIGTTFKLFLPSSADRMVGMTVPPPVASGTRGSETVLLVEDAPAVRQLAHRALAARGFSVLDAESGQHALEVVDAYAGPIHIVVTDVVLPGMNGRELVERLQVLHPDLRALFMSGYTADVLLHHRVTHHATPFLEKPFTVEALIRAVRDALDQPGVDER